MCYFNIEQVFCWVPVNTGPAPSVVDTLGNNKENSSPEQSSYAAWQSSLKIKMFCNL
jgi:hypothetical protein